MTLHGSPVWLYVRTGICSLLLFAAAGSYAQSPPVADSVTVAIAPEYNDVSKTHRLFFGENYRKLWATPVRFRVFHLDREQGGLTITERGGGMQTKSLRLKDTSGKEWVLRSVQKDPEKALPVYLRATVAKEILQDLISTSHPYGAITVPPLAAALGIRHTRPEIVFMPDDTALGEHRKDFANTVLLFEEREPQDATDTDNTQKVLDKLREDNDTRADQKRVLRARLLDMLIGDWDRHEDQWRWEKQKDGDETVYFPYPRDRDQVYYNPDGIIPSIASRKWLLPKFQGFREKIRDINGFNFNARYFDRSFLNGLTQADWEKEIDFVQRTVTDSVIIHAVNQLPNPVSAISGPEIIQKLTARRSILKQEALNYYRFLSKAVDIPASDKKELFRVNHNDNGELSVSVHKIKNDGDASKVIYQRSFQPGITQEIRLYGQGGEDVFLVRGSGRPAIRVRMIGGSDKDIFWVDSSLGRKRKLYVYDSTGENNTLPSRSRARFRLSADSSVNTYQQKNFRYDRLAPRAFVGYNLDDGLLLGAGFAIEKHGFRKEPFAARHRFLLGGSLATSSFFVNYSGLWKQIAGSRYDLSLDADARAPRNTSNFFGTGNETDFIRQETNPIRFYRTRYDFVTTSVKLHRALGKKGTINAGLAGQFYNNDRTKNEDRFIRDYDLQNPEEEVFSQKVFGGLVAAAGWDTRNNEWWPSHGTYFTTSLTGMRQLNKRTDSYGQVLSGFSFYIPLGRDTGFIIANRVGAGTTIGRPAFFQQLFLGGNQNLRGFRNFRFAGKTMLYHNLELRLKLFDFNSYLFPGSAGLTAFNDIGRVWADGESSNKWHNGFGGGVYIIPAQLVLVQASVGISSEEVLPYVSLGFRF